MAGIEEYTHRVASFLSAEGLFHHKTVLGLPGVVGVLAFVFVGVDGIGAFLQQAFADVHAGAKSVHQGIRPFVKVVEIPRDMGHGREKGSGITRRAGIVRWRRAGICGQFCGRCDRGAMAIDDNNAYGNLGKLYDGFIS